MNKKQEERIVEAMQGTNISSELTDDKLPSYIVNVKQLLNSGAHALSDKELSYILSRIFQSKKNYMSFRDNPSSFIQKERVEFYLIDIRKRSDFTAGEIDNMKGVLRLHSQNLSDLQLAFIISTIFSNKEQLALFNNNPDKYIQEARLELILSRIRQQPEFNDSQIDEVRDKLLAHISKLSDAQLTHIVTKIFAKHPDQLLFRRSPDTVINEELQNIAKKQAGWFDKFNSADQNAEDLLNLFSAQVAVFQKKIGRPPSVHEFAEYFCGYLEYLPGFYDKEMRDDVLAKLYYLNKHISYLEVEAGKQRDDIKGTEYRQQKQWLNEMIGAVQLMKNLSDNEVKAENGQVITMQNFPQYKNAPKVRDETARLRLQVQEEYDLKILTLELEKTFAHMRDLTEEMRLSTDLDERNFGIGMESMTMEMEKNFHIIIGLAPELEKAEDKQSKLQSYRTYVNNTFSDFNEKYNRQMGKGSTGDVAFNWFKNVTVGLLSFGIVPLAFKLVTGHLPFQTRIEKMSADLERTKEQTTLLAHKL